MSVPNGIDDRRGGCVRCEIGCIHDEVGRPNESIPFPLEHLEMAEPPLFGLALHLISFDASPDLSSLAIKNHMKDWLVKAGESCLQLVPDFLSQHRLHSHQG